MAINETKCCYFGPSRMGVGYNRDESLCAFRHIGRRVPRAGVARSMYLCVVRVGVPFIRAASESAARAQRSARTERNGRRRCPSKERNCTTGPTAPYLD